MTQTIDGLIEKAFHARQSGNSDIERSLLNQAMELAPENPVVCNARGMRALQDGDFGLAQTLFERAVQADPGVAALLMNLASAHRAKQDWATELTVLESVLELDQRHFMAQLRLAEWHEQHGDPVVAAEHWRNILALAPADDQLPPALAERLVHARNFVASQNVEFKHKLRAGLESARLGADESALRRFDACMGTMLGERRVYQNECSGLHYPFLPADEFFERKHFPWMADLEAKADIIRQEFLALYQSDAEAIRPYVRQDKGTPENKWTGLDNKLDWGACFLWEYGVPNQPILDRCPETAKALAALPRNHIPGRAPTAFFSLLRPNTHIPPHTGVTNTRAIIHLPLIVPDNCGFRVGNETRQWVPGQAFAFDDTIEHEAWNRSNELRVVLIFDVWNPHLTEAEQRLLVNFFETADSLDMNPAERRARVAEGKHK